MKIKEYVLDMTDGKFKCPECNEVYDFIKLKSSCNKGTLIRCCPNKDCGCEIIVESEKV